MDFHDNIQSIAPDEPRSVQTAAYVSRASAGRRPELSTAANTQGGGGTVQDSRKTPHGGTSECAQRKTLRTGQMAGAAKRPKRAMSSWEFDYLSEEHMTGFDNYKYSSIDTSPLSNYVMHPFWNWAVKLVPLNIAPNVLTFGGFLLNVVSVALLSWYDFSFDASSNDAQSSPVPPWVWLVCAFNQFMAHTLDGLDGKHARRTGLSGPMGELFDHGLDSWASLFMPLCVLSVFGRYDSSVSVFRFYLLLWNVHYCFLLSHWEKYNTGILFLPWGYDVSQIFLTGSFLLTYFYSHNIWKFVFMGVRSGVHMELALHIGAVGLSLPVCLWNIYQGYKNKTLKQKTCWEGLRPLVAPTIFMAMTTFWVLKSPSDIVERQPRVMFVMVGTLFANIASRLIVNQMTGTRCEIFNGLLYCVAAAIFAVFRFQANEVICLYLLTAIVLLAHVHYGTCVVRQISDHFGINCFSVVRRRPKSEVAEKSS